MNGLRVQANNFLFDGIDNNESLVNTIVFFVPPDAIQEFRVDTNVAPAEYRPGLAAALSMLLINPAQMIGTEAFSGKFGTAQQTLIRTIFRASQRSRSIAISSGLRRGIFAQE